MCAAAPAATDTLMLHSTDADADACFGLLPDHANTATPENLLVSIGAVFKKHLVDFRNVYFQLNKTI